MQKSSVSILKACALAISCVVSLAAPAAASGPHKESPAGAKPARANHDASRTKAGRRANAPSRGPAIQARARAESKNRRPHSTAQVHHGAAAQPALCEHDPVSIVTHEGATPVRVVLTLCDGRPAPGALVALGQWLGTPSPETKQPTPHARHEPGTQHDPMHLPLLARLQTIATQFPGKTLHLHPACNREAGRGAHARFHALDVSVEGTPMDRQVAFCRSLPDTTCGQIEGQNFLHIEPRQANAGHLFWVDLQPSAK